jgi:hypothetical protein
MTYTWEEYLYIQFTHQLIDRKYFANWVESMPIRIWEELNDEYHHYITERQ